MLVLSVPFAEKNEIKSLGARWEPMLKAWHVLIGAPEHIFARWAKPDKRPSQATVQRKLIAEVLSAPSLRLILARQVSRIHHPANQYPLTKGPYRLLFRLK